MLNTYQKQTKSGKPVINQSTKLPEYNRSIHYRLNALRSQLGFDNKESRWQSICSEVQLLTL